MTRLQPLGIAFQFLTRLPVSVNDDYSPSAIGYSLLCYPLVGGAIGVLLWLVALLLQPWLPGSVMAALLLVVWVGVTGALHLDGLADTADAWIGGQGDKERTLTIMKDPTCGPVAVAVVVLLLLVKFTALQALLQLPQLAWLIVAPLIGRVTILLLFLTTPYIRAGGLGEVLANSFPRQAAIVICLLIGAGLMVFSLTLTIALIVVCGFGFMVFRYWMLRCLQGCTGDTVGTMVELQELLALVVLIAFLQ